MSHLTRPWCEVDASSSTPQHVNSIEEPVRCVSCGNNHTAAITGESLESNTMKLCLFLSKIVNHKRLKYFVMA